MSRCIWALLSSNNFEFMTTSHYNKLQRISLFQLIHPDETALAKQDFTRFLEFNALGGSVTRCRLRDYSRPNFMLSSMTDAEEWIVVDLVMYIATSDLVLAFFHPVHRNNVQDHSAVSICGDHTDFHVETCLSTLKEALFEQQQNQQNLHRIRSPSLSSSSSLSSNNSESQQQQQLDMNNSPLPAQQLYLINSRTSSLLMSLPEHLRQNTHQPYNHSNNMKLNDLIIDRPSLSPGYSCFRFIQLPYRSNAVGQQVNRLLIDYGPISFLLVRTEKNSRSLAIQTSFSETLSSRRVNNKRHLNAPSNRSLPSKYRRRSLTPPFAIPQQKYSPPPQQTNSYSYTSPPPTNTVVASSSSKDNLQQHSLFPTIPNRNKLYIPSRNYCQNCGTSSSPEWRKGPSGHKTLCNACGLRYSRSLARQARIITNNNNDKPTKRHLSQSASCTCCRPEEQQHHYPSNSFQAPAPAPAPAPVFQSQFTPHHGEQAAVVEPLQKLDVINNKNSTTMISSHYNTPFDYSSSGSPFSKHPSFNNNAHLLPTSTEVPQHRQEQRLLPSIINSQRRHEQHPKHSIQFAII
ncbi:hypothetical protein BDF20DRAFT_996821 [Mycotypha africana]|uniref:uncharacterized protein n=1 Tax=Mycotypha africana TaxID=64632 RepID=UPI002300E7F2|nr:uncharacterized protein BDF20DRAFT_996821 [Mycotypha africana]KAI8990820.1 hypothetical protein BDF20DRAFT_996821 [Mycotypha africana]